jgi:hypothetical protein
MKARKLIREHGGLLLFALMVIVGVIASSCLIKQQTVKPCASKSMLILPRSGSAIGSLLLEFGPKGFLTKLPGSYEDGSEAGSIDWEFYDSGWPKQVTVYYRLKPGENTKRMLIQSKFLKEPSGYTGAPEYEYASTCAWYPDGTELECLLQPNGTYDENVWQVREGKRIKKQHSLYKREPAPNTQDPDRWTVVNREEGNLATGELSLKIWHDDKGVIHSRYVGENGETRECTKFQGYPVESDYHKGDLKPYREVCYKGLWTILWLNDKTGRHIDSYVYRHPMVIGSAEPPRAISQVTRTVWIDGKPVVDQVFAVDTRVSNQDAKPPKLVYIFQGVTPIARYGKKYEEKYMRVVVYDGGKRVHMVTLAAKRMTTEADSEAYPYEDLPEHVDTLNYSPGMTPPKDKIVWIFGKDGSLQFVSGYDYASVLKQLTVIGNERPQSRRDLDGDIKPVYFLNDPPEPWNALPPLKIPQKLDPVDPILVHACPNIDPAWLKIPDSIPDEPVAQDLPPY